MKKLTSIFLVIMIVFITACSYDKEVPNHISYSNYNDFINGVLEKVGNAYLNDQKSTILINKNIIVPTILKEGYINESYSAGSNNKSYLNYEFVLKDINAPRTKLNGAISVYIDYNNELASLDNIYQQWLDEQQKGNDKGKIEVLKGNFKDNEYVVREYIPDVQKDKINKIPSCTVDLVIYGQRVRLTFMNEFNEEFLGWIEFKKLDLTDKINDKINSIKK